MLRICLEKLDFMLKDMFRKINFTLKSIVQECTSNLVSEGIILRGEKEKIIKGYSLWQVMGYRL